MTTHLLSLVTFFSIVSTIVRDSAPVGYNISLIVLSQVLFQGLDAPVKQIITLVMGFLVICLGITILQLSKVDPAEFKGLDRRSTILLQATRSRVEGAGEDSEKGYAAVEDPGVDSVRGSFGALGSIIRFKTMRRLNMTRSAGAELRARTSRHHQSDPDSVDASLPFSPDPAAGLPEGMVRHQLYDPPVSSSSTTLDPLEALGQIENPSSKRPQTIKFGNRDVVHSYARVGVDDDRSAVHEYRESNVPMSNPPPTFKPEEPYSKPPAISNPHASHLVDPPPPKGHKRTGSGTPKKYPKGNDGDDVEESEHLWGRNKKQSDEESEMELEESLKGLRLVKQPDPSNF